MHQHKVRSRPLSALQGIAVVLGVVAAGLVDALLANLLSRVAPALVSTTVFWGLGAVLALWVMRRFVLSYSYILSSSLIRVSYAYGRYERVMTDIYRNNILACGTLEEMREHYPGAKVNHADLKGCDLPTLTVACRDDGKPALYVLQPDEEIREAILKSVPAKKKK